MNYPETIAYLNHFEFYGIKLGLENMRKLAARLGNPQDSLKFIHIAGTNGKGSVSSFLANILKSSGYKTGLYTSPHLVQLEERFQIDGQLISSEDMVRLTEKLKSAIDELAQEDCFPTFFEVTTALALLYFAESKVDYVVWEVGLGGRLDATNIVTPILGIITSIGYDHIEQLGADIRSISAEKAGIIKPGLRVITAAEGAALEVIEEIAKQQNSELTIYPRDISYRLVEKKKENNHTVSQEFDYLGKSITLSNLNTQMLGMHQLLNATLALGAVEILAIRKTPIPISPAILEGMGFPPSNMPNSGMGLPIPGLSSPSGLTGDPVPGNVIRMLTTGVHKGIAETNWPGRIEVVKEHPLVILDGAHNESGAEVLRESLLNDFPQKRFILVLGLSKGKHRDQVIKVLGSMADELVLTSAQSHRALALEDLKSLADGLHKPYKIAKTSTDAVEYAVHIAGPNDMICVAGSLYLVGEIRPYFQK